MLAALLPALVFQQKADSLPKLDEVLAKMGQYTRTLAGYHDVWEVRIDTGTEVSAMTFARDIDREKIWRAISVGDQTLLEEFYDGKEHATVLPARKQFFRRTMSESPYPAYQAQKQEIPVGAFNITFSTPYDFTVLCNPSLQVQSFTTEKVGAKQMRRLNASAKNGEDGLVVVTLWIQADRWMLDKAEARIESSKSKSKMLAKLVERNEKASFSSGRFQLEDEKVAGFERLKTGDGN